MKSCNIVATRFFTICVLFCYLRLDESVDSAGVMIWWRLITPKLTWRKGRQTSLLSRICTVVQYAVLEAMTTVNGKTENSTSRKYKMDKDIQTPHRIWLRRGVELLCTVRAKSAHPNLLGEYGKFEFFTHTHTGKQSNKFFHLAYRSQIWKDLKHLRLKTRGFTPRCAFLGYRWWQIMFRGPNPPKTHFGDHLMLNLL